MKGGYATSCKIIILHAGAYLQVHSQQHFLKASGETTHALPVNGLKKAI